MFLEAVQLLKGASPNRLTNQFKRWVINMVIFRDSGDRLSSDQMRSVSFDFRIRRVPSDYNSDGLLPSFWDVDARVGIQFSDQLLKRIGKSLIILLASGSPFLIWYLSSEQKLPPLLVPPAKTLIQPDSSSMSPE